MLTTYLPTKLLEKRRETYSGTVPEFLGREGRNSRVERGWGFVQVLVVIRGLK